MIKNNNPCYIIDKNFIVRYYNESLKEIFPNVSKGEYCFKAFSNRNTPCDDCPLRRNDKCTDTKLYNPNNGKDYRTFISSIEYDGEDCYSFIAKEYDENDVKIDSLNRLLNKEQIYKKAIYSNACGSFFANLSANTIQDLVMYKDKEQRMQSMEDTFDSYDSYVSYVSIERALTKKDEFKGLADRDNLIKLYHNNVYAPEITFWCLDPTDVKKYYKQIFFLTEDEATHDINAYSVIKDITSDEEQKKKTEEYTNVIDILSTDYTSIFLLDFNNNEYIVFRSSDIYTKNIKKIIGVKSLEDKLDILLKEIVYKDDLDFIIRNLKYDIIASEIERSGVCRIPVRLYYNNVIHYHLLKIFSLEKDNYDRLLFAFLNIDDQHKLEEEKYRKDDVDIYNNQLEALARSITLDFDCIFYVSLDTYKVTTLRISELFTNIIPKEEYENDFASSIIKLTRKIVNKKDQDKILSLLNKKYLLSVLNESPIHLVDFEATIDGESQYYRIKISRDQQFMENLNIVLGIFNVDKQVRLENKYKIELEESLRREKAFRRAVVSEASIYLVANLSKDEVVSPINFIRNNEEIDISSELDFSENRTYTSWHEKAMDEFIIGNRNIYDKEMNIENLLVKYYKGDAMSEFTAWVNMPYVGKKCLKIMSYLARDNINDDIIMLCVAYDVTRKERNEQEIKRNNEIINVLSNEYVAVFYADLLNRSYKVYKIEPSEVDIYNRCNNDNDNYHELLSKYINHYVYEEDRLKMLNVIDPAYIKKELTDKNVIITPYRFNNRKDISHWEVKIFKLLESGLENKVVIAFSNKDEEVRESELRREELEKAMNEANSANVAKSNFLAQVSHDIRTPLTAISGFTNLAKEFIDDKNKVKDYLDKLDIANKHLNKLVNDILDMRRIETGKIIISEEPFDLYDYIKDLQTLVIDGANNKGIEFSVYFDHINDSKLFGDTVRINQCLINIISNAIEYTNKGGHITLSISEEEDDYDRGLYTFTVTDDGIGMSEDFVSHIFDYFERENKLLSADAKNHGLGMSITKGLVEIMNGDISVKSKRGKGTTVRFSIPLRYQLDRLLISIDKEKVDVDLSKLKILVVEDNELSRIVITDTLQVLGITYDELEDGSEVVQILSKSTDTEYDAILMDLSMPYMDGYTATKIIRSLKNEKVKNIPIIALTSNAFLEDKEKAFNVGMDDYLTKPIDGNLLVETLSKLCTKKK